MELAKRPSAATRALPQESAAADLGSDPRTEAVLRWLALAPAVAIFAALAWPMFHGQFFPVGDMMNSYAPMRYCYWQSLKSGDNFLWDPRIYCGTYFYSYGESSMCHPLNLFLYKFLPFNAAFNLEFLFNYFCLYLGTYLLLRRWRMSSAVALFGALLFTFGGANLFHFVHLSREDTLRSMPWVLLLTDIVMCSQSWRVVVAAQAGVSLLTASALVAGSSHYFIYTMFAMAAVVVGRLWTHRGFRRVLLLAVAGFLGIVMSAVQIVPSVEGVNEMGRSHDPLFKLLMALHPANLLQLVSPYLFKDRYYCDGHNPIEGNTHELALYFTAFGTVALAWLWMRRSAMRDQRLFVRGAFFFGLGALVLAMGKYGVAYVFLSEIPFLDKFKDSCRYIVLVNLAMTVLACIALGDILRVLREKVTIPWREQWPLLVPLGLSALTFLGAEYFLLIPHHGHPYAEQLTRNDWDPFLGLASIAAAVACCAAVARGRVEGVVGIVLLTFAEIALGIVWTHVWRGGPATEKDLIAATRPAPLLTSMTGCGPATLDQVIAAAPKPPDPPAKGTRVFSRRYDNLLEVAGYEQMEGLVHAPMERLIPRAFATGATQLKVLQLAGVVWAQTDIDKWFKVPVPPLPRARLVAEAVVAEYTPAELAKGEFAKEAAAFAEIDPATTAIIDRKIRDLAGPPGNARVVTDRPGRVEIETEVPGRQVLVWAERFNPGWHVTVDGQPAPLVRTYGDFMGCPVEAGKRHVVFLFEPASFARGLQITIAGSLAALLLAGLLCLPVGGSPRRMVAQWFLS